MISTYMQEYIDLNFYWIMFINAKSKLIRTVYEIE